MKGNWGWLIVFGLVVWAVSKTKAKEIVPEVSTTTDYFAYPETGPYISETLPVSIGALEYYALSDIDRAKYFMTSKSTWELESTFRESTVEGYYPLYYGGISGITGWERDLQEAIQTGRIPPVPQTLVALGSEEGWFWNGNQWQLQRFEPKLVSPPLF